MSTNEPAHPQDEQDVRSPAGAGLADGAAEAGANGVCFVISPFGEWHDDYYLKIHMPAIQAAGLMPKRADSLFRSSNIVHDIWHMVITSRVIVADLTGRNPNVFYELGLAHAARKPVLLLTQDIEDVPFDLRGLRVISYDIRNPQWGATLQEIITAGLVETLESPRDAVLPTFLREDPGNHPHVSQEDQRFLDLQQQINALRAELRTSGRDTSEFSPNQPTQASQLAITVMPQE